MSELESCYSLEECNDVKEVKRVLNAYKKAGKIEFKIESKILNIEDLELSESEITDLVELFDKYDVFVYDMEDYDIDADDYYDMDDYDSDY